MRYTVQFTDGIEEGVTVDEARAENEDHLAEMVAKASSRPDDVDDYWPTDDEPTYEDVIAEARRLGHEPYNAEDLGGEYRPEAIAAAIASLTQQETRT